MLFIQINTNNLSFIVSQFIQIIKPLSLFDVALYVPLIYGKSLYFNIETTFYYFNGHANTK